MNMNEQKSLGQIAYEFHVSNQDAREWRHLSDGARDAWNSLASTVEQAVLQRLGGEWILLPDNTVLQNGDEEYKPGFGWEPVADPILGLKSGYVFLYRRRIRQSSSQEPKTERFAPKFQFGDKVRRVEPDASKATLEVINTHGRSVQTIDPEKETVCARTGASSTSQWHDQDTLEFTPPTTEEEPIHDDNGNTPEHYDAEEECQRLALKCDTLTRERDEARRINVETLRVSQDQHSRAEAAEKKLAEVESLLSAHKADTTWMKMPTKKPTTDSDLDLLVLAVSMNVSSRPFTVEWMSKLHDFWTHYIPVKSFPLPTPPEEDAFEKWWYSKDAPLDITKQDGKYIFEAGRQSVSKRLSP
jgi:hypothetical protein